MKTSLDKKTERREIDLMRKIIRSSETDIYYGEVSNTTNAYNGWGLKMNPHGEIYYGEWDDNARSGFGANVYPDSRIWIGYWDNDIALSNGVTIKSVGDPFVVFWGDLKDGKPSKGCGLSNDGKLFSGEWSEWHNEEFDGKGSFSWRDGRIYAGKWKGGQQTIGGVIRRSDGRLNGSWNDEISGIKTISWNNDNGRVFFCGKFDDESIRNANGTMYYANKSIFSGNFVKGCKEGIGFYRESEELLYIGEWKNDEKNGKGVVIWFSSDKKKVFQIYIGEFKNGKYDGWGLFAKVKSNEEEESQLSLEIDYCGEWKEGFRNGEAVVNIDSAYDFFEGRWEHDKAVYPDELVERYATKKEKVNYEDGSVYEGVLKDGKRSGNGKMLYADGRIYEGNWSDDLESGKGVCNLVCDQETGKWYMLTEILMRVTGRMIKEMDMVF